MLKRDLASLVRRCLSVWDPLLRDVPPEPTDRASPPRALTTPGEGGAPFVRVVREPDEAVVLDAPGTPVLDFLETLDPLPTEALSPDFCLPNFLGFVKPPNFLRTKAPDFDMPERTDASSISE